MPVLQELGIALVPFSPLGRGFLTGKLDASVEIAPTDFRANLPRFSAENRKANERVVQLLERIAAPRGAMPAQVALAWLLAQRQWIVPIPGTTQLHRLEENLGAVHLELTPEDLAELDTASKWIAVAGARYSPELDAMTGL